jgi:hypothetical protein
MDMEALELADIQVFPVKRSAISNTTAEQLFNGPTGQTFLTNAGAIWEAISV